MAPDRTDLGPGVRMFSHVSPVHGFGRIGHGQAAPAIDAVPVCVGAHSIDVWHGWFDRATHALGLTGEAHLHIGEGLRELVAPSAQSSRDMAMGRGCGEHRLERGVPPQG